MAWMLAIDVLLETTTAASSPGEEAVGFAGVVIVILLLLFFAGGSSSDDGDDSGGSGRQPRGLCENCGYEWTPRKPPSERSTDPKCPDCGSTRVSIHYNR